MIIAAGSSNRTVRLPQPRAERISVRCLCLNTDFDDVENVAVHIAACILGQTITDENLPQITRALKIYKDMK